MSWPPMLSEDQVKAIPPFIIGPHGWVYDSTGCVVLACYRDDTICSRRYASNRVAEDPHYICPCGRLGQRMEEVSPDRCGITTS